MRVKGEGMPSAPPKTRIVIAGAGALGRELLGWIRHDADPSEVVFIDDTRTDAGVSEFYAASPVIATIDGYQPQPEDVVLVGAADPKAREAIAERLTARGGVELSIYAHRTVIRGNCIVGPGSILMPHALVSVDAALGAFTVVNTNSSIGHDVVLDDFCTLSSHVDLMGHVKVGRRVFFGSGARVLPGVTIGDDAYIGAGAVVCNSVEAGARVFGNPGRRIL